MNNSNRDKGLSLSSARFRRDVLEGTLEEMLDQEEPELDEDNFKEEGGNFTLSHREKRQAEFPGAPEQDNSKFVFFILTCALSMINFTNC